jgi:hypothetical protein
MKSTQLQQGSIVLGLVFGLGVLGLGIAATTLTFSTSAVTNHTTASAGVRSLVTADSITREGVYQVLQAGYSSNDIVDFKNSNPEFKLLNLTSLSTDSAEYHASGTWPIIEVTSTSSNPRTTRKVVVTLDLFPSAFAFDQAVYSHGQISANGNLTINGNAYATNGIALSGNANINGDAYSPLAMNSNTKNRISGESYENSSTIIPPTIATSSYKVLAQSANTYFTDISLARTYIQGNPAGFPVVFVESPNELSLNANSLAFFGTIISTGGFSMNGGTISANPSGDPLAVYSGGNAAIRGNATINGIVYIDGTTTFGNGTNRINGTLLSTQPSSTLSVNGNAMVTYNATYGKNWQNITGLDTESGTAPMVKNWHEQ